MRDLQLAFRSNSITSPQGSVSFATAVRTELVGSYLFGLIFMLEHKPLKPSGQGLTLEITKDFYPQRSVEQLTVERLTQIETRYIARSYGQGVALDEFDRVSGTDLARLQHRQVETETSTL